MDIASMSGIAVNFFQYLLSKDHIQIEVLPTKNYPTKDAYQKLRDENEDYRFYRLDEEIYLWPVLANAKHNLPAKKELISVNLHPRVVSKMVEFAVIERFRGLDQYNIKEHKYSHTWELLAKKNLVKEKIEGLSLKKRVTLGAHYLKPNQDNIIYGFTLSLNTKNSFLWQESDFIANGIEVDGLKIRDESIIADRKAMYRFLEATGQRDVFESEVELVENHENGFRTISRIVSWLEKNQDSIFLPDNLKITSIKLKYLPFGGITTDSIPAPRRFFFNGVFNTDSSLKYYNQQVKAYKPYSYGAFEDRLFSIGVIFPSEYEGTTEVFISKLEKSLKEDLHLKKIEFQMVKITSSDLKDYDIGIYRDEELLRKCDLFILVVSQDHEELPPSRNPYFHCKAKLLGNGIPTQGIQYETIKGYVHPLAMNNIALNIYAKLGGTAWTIEKEEKRKEELIIGIGSTTSLDGKHILGIAQVFQSDGRYIVGDCAPLSTFEDYSQNLEEYLFQQLKEVIDTQINTSERFRLIFHLYKSAGKENEIAALERLMQRLKTYDFDYALLHIGYGHNFRLYNDDGKKPLKKGSYIQLSPYTALLHFVPDSDLPLKIELDKRSKGFDELFYLAKQVYWFSNLSHRSYNPAKRTVTIMYPSLMAKMTEDLSKVQNWDYSRIKNVRDKLWFI